MEAGLGYKTLLVHAEPTPEAAGRLACAVDLADRFSALLIGCGCEAAPVLLEPPFHTGPDVAALGSQRIERNIEAARETFEAAARSVAHRWSAASSAPTEAIALHARAADLIVASRTTADRFNALRHVDPGLLVAIAGRPVLITPDSEDHLRAERVVVCWKDVREARRAVADALPFLVQAADVLVVEVADPEDLKGACARAGEVAEALCRHGVFARSEVMAHDRKQTATLLEDRARAFGADLIVAGGYGRSRLSEWVFGGVTNAFLQDSRGFVLLSH
jgi:nucleotide-binding universal stress UspA family protein